MLLVALSLSRFSVLSSSLVRSRPLFCQSNNSDECLSMRIPKHELGKSTRKEPENGGRIWLQILLKEYIFFRFCLVEGRSNCSEFHVISFLSRILDCWKKVLFQKKPTSGRGGKRPPWAKKSLPGLSPYCPLPVCRVTCLIAAHVSFPVNEKKVNCDNAEKKYVQRKGFNYFFLRIVSEDCTSCLPWKGTSCLENLKSPQNSRQCYFLAVLLVLKPIIYSPSWSWELAVHDNALSFWCVNHLLGFRLALEIALLSSNSGINLPPRFSEHPWENCIFVHVSTT